MSRFKEQLMELGQYAQEFPDGSLVFRVPLSTLHPSRTAERPLIEGQWTASIELPDGSIVKAARGHSGEHSMEFLTCAMRERKNG